MHNDYDDDELVFDERFHLVIKWNYTHERIGLEFLNLAEVYHTIERELKKVTLMRKGYEGKTPIEFSIAMTEGEVGLEFAIVSVTNEAELVVEAIETGHEVVDNFVDALRGSHIYLNGRKGFLLPF